MSRWLLCGLLLAFAAFNVPTALGAQRSPILDHLGKARIALDELRFRAADSLAMFAIRTFGSQMNRDQRAEALGISASARFPEVIEGAVQYPDSALVALRAIVRLDPDLRLREDVSWSGLDSLMEVARATTFVPRLRAQSEATFGEDSAGLLAEGIATRPARWRIELRPVAGGAPIWSENSLAGTGASLSLRLAITEGHPSLTTGEYEIRIVARDVASADSVIWSYAARVDAPSLELVPSPAPFDSTTLLPEIAPPARARGIVMGVLVGAVTVVGTSALRGSTALAAAADADGRAVGIGAALAVGSILAGFVDKGAPLPMNRALNARSGLEHADAVQAATLENQRRIGAYRVTVVIQEPK